MEETIFNYIDSVLFNKKKLNKINERETQFNLYMLNRWCSMYSPDLAQIINQTSNQFKEVLSLKQDQYDFCFNMFPKSKKRKIEYIKKQKNDKKEEDVETKQLADCMELSQREIKQLIEFLK
jgi:hypothetical protein